MQRPTAELVEDGVEGCFLGGSSGVGHAGASEVAAPVSTSVGCHLYIRPSNQPRDVRDIRRRRDGLTHRQLVQDSNCWL